MENLKYHTFLLVVYRGVARIFQRRGHRGYSPLLSLVYQRAQSYYRAMKAHINQRQEPLTKVLYKKTNFKKVGFSTMAFMAKILSEYCRLFAQKKAYQGGIMGTPGPPLATLLVYKYSQTTLH